MGKQHPTRRREGSILQCHRPVRIPLIAVQQAVRVKARTPQAEPALEWVIDADAHGRRVEKPPVARPQRAAMSRTLRKAVRYEGIRQVFRRHKRPKRMFALVYAVCVGVEFRAGGGVLQVIPSVVLGHPRALDPRGAVFIRAVLAHALIAKLFGVSGN